MKTIITLLTGAVLVAGATNAMALDRQATDDAAGYAISRQAAPGFGGAFASAGPARSAGVQHHDDIQLDGR
jgi:hypothetical protein